ncbi:MAG: class I SAM-dependent methyltransferase [Nitrosopumilaceae archaeon]|jgi:O-methyltransferase involved in polyketide biosynthesis
MNDLSSTSALVLLWSIENKDENPSSSKYLEFLNLDSAKDLHSKCNQVWPFYSEVIKNRKKCVRDLILSGLNVENNVQIVILGAGWDTLFLDIITKNKSIKIFEIDFSMDEKRKVIEKMDGTIFDSLTLISSDLKDPKVLLESLKKYGWDPKNPTIVVLEGISYYLSEKVLNSILRIFQTRNGKNRIILEYLVSHDLISKKEAKVAKNIFDLIAKDTGLPQITRYNQNKIEKIIEDHNGSLIKMFTMKEMEMNRAGENVFFKKSKNGWIEICYFII